MDARSVVRIGFIAAALIIAGTASVLWVFRERALVQAERELANVVLLLAEQTERALQQVDLILRYTAEELRDEPRAAAATGTAAAHRAMVERIRGVPMIRALIATDAAGRVILRTPGFPPPEIDYSDRRWFSVHRERGQSGAMHVGKPGVDDVLSLPMSRAIEDANGALLGVVGGVVDPRYFGRTFGAVDLGPGSRIALFRMDALMLAGINVAESDVGRSFADAGWAAQLREGRREGALRAPGRLDGSARLIAFRAGNVFPVVIVASQTEGTALASWNRLAWLFGIGGALSATLLFLWSVLLGREHRREEALQEELEDSRSRYAGIVESAMDAIITVDDANCIVVFNRAAEQMFGYPADAVLGTPLDRLLPDRFREGHRAHLRAFERTGITTRRMGRTVLYALRASGEEFPISASIAQAMVGGRRFFTVILRDITEGVRAQAALESSNSQLRELSRVAHDAREAERTRIARELHDELAQWITALRMDAAWVRSRLAASATGDPAVTPKLDRMRELIDQAGKAVRRIASDLRPVTLDDLGLRASLEWLAREFTRRHGVAVSIRIDLPDEAIGDPLATGVFRMVQEALTNIARHAGVARSARAGRPALRPRCGRWPGM